MKARSPHNKIRFAFNYNGKPSRPAIFVEATSKSKAWKEFRRHHVPHAKRKDYIVLDGARLC